MVAMVEHPYATAGTIRPKYIHDPQNGAVEFVYSIPNCLLLSCKTNMTTILAIIFNLIVGKMDLLNQMQVTQMAHTVVLFFNKHISTSVWMCFASATMIQGKEAN